MDLEWPYPVMLQSAETLNEQNGSSGGRTADCMVKITPSLKCYRICCEFVREFDEAPDSIIFLTSVAISQGMIADALMRSLHGLFQIGFSHRF